MVAAGAPAEPAETLLGSAISALCSSFLPTTGSALAAIGLAPVLGGSVPGPAAWFATIIAALVVARYVTSGDVIPAIVYLPTLLIGLALLLGGR